MRSPRLQVPLLDHQNIGKAGHFKNIHNRLTNVNDFHRADLLHFLLCAQKKMQSIGSMKVKNVCEAVMEVFEMTGFADILVIE